MEHIYLPLLKRTDVIISFMFTSGLDYEPHSCVQEKDDESESRTPRLTTGPDGERLPFGGISDIFWARRTDVRSLAEALLTIAHISYAVTREAWQPAHVGGKWVRRTFFDLTPGPAKTDLDNKLGAELLRFAGRSLWTVEVYRNPRNDKPGKTGLHIRCFSRSEFRDAAGEIPLVWPRDAKGNVVKTDGKVPMEPTFVLTLAGTPKTATTLKTETAEVAA